MRVLYTALSTIIFCSFTVDVKPVRILSKGDSITQVGKSDRNDYTYLLPLQIILYKENENFDYLGLRHKGFQKEAMWAEVAEGIPFNLDHEGYYGNKTADASRKASESYDSYHIPPDIILDQLGTNDQKYGDFENNVEQPIHEVIRFYRIKNPKVQVLLGHLNFNDSEVAAEIRTVVDNVSKELRTMESLENTVNHYLGRNEIPSKSYLQISMVGHNLV